MLSPTLFNIVLERIMKDALDGHIGTISIGGRSITNHRFADDIDGITSSEKELRQLVDRLDNTSIDYIMEINVDKTKIMKNNFVGVITSIKAIEEVQNFIYLGATISQTGSRHAKIRRIAQATAILKKLKLI